MINPYVILGIVLAWFASLTGVGYWQHNAGQVSERAAWQQRDNKELADANTKIQSLQVDARAKEAENNRNIATLSKNYQGALTNVDSEKDKFITGVHNGTIILRQPVASTNQASGSPVGKIIISPGGCDGKTGSELSRESSEFLYTKASDADKIVEQLDACQEIVIEDRRVCGN